MALTLVFTSNPANDTELELGTATFVAAGSASVPGTEISYQWQLGANDAGYSNITGATGSIYSFVTTLGDSGEWYRCVISATGASDVNSSTAQLSVLNDDRFYHASNGEAGTNRFLRLRSLGYL